MKFTKFLFLSMAVICLALCLVGCGDDGKLTMATNANFPPYEYKDGEEFKGIDVEIATAIAEKLGMELEIKDVEFGSIIAGVDSGKYEMGMAGMTVTPDRQKSVDFSDTYATGIQVIIVTEDSPIKAIEDLDGTDYIIGVQQDTTGDIYASDTVENGGYGEDRVIRYKNGADAVQALVKDKVQAVIIDNEPAKAFVEAQEGLKILETEYAVEDYAIAIKKGNKDLLDKINNALKELKEDGTIDAIVEKYIPSK